MKKEQNRKKILIQMGLVIALGIFAVLFFLFSVRGLLLTEAENRLLSMNKKQEKRVKEYKSMFLELSEKQVETIPDVATTEFDGEFHSYVLNGEGDIIAFIGEDARIDGDQVETQLSLFIYNNKDKFRVKVKKEDGLVEKQQFMSGKYYYMVIRVTDVVPGGYLVSIVPANDIDQEISSTWHIAITIIILAITTVGFGGIYSIYKKKTNNRRLSKDGEPDIVTGLPHYMVHKLRAQQLINAEQDTYAYVSFSFDKYALILQLSGKEYCDYLLKSVAAILTNWVKEDETLARVHDDLFGMLLKYDDELSFRQRLIRMFKHAGDIPNTDNNFCNIRFRSGVCLVESETDVDKVIARAKKAREIREVGSIANITFFQSKSFRSNQREEIAKEASNAMYEHRFLVFLQPKVRMDSNKISGAEALIRWNHPKYGLLTPNVFLPLLEENGMITQIDFFVLETICKQIRDWQDQGIKVAPISVNLSIRQLEDHQLAQQILEITDQYQVPHELIEFEFPENAVYDRMNELLYIMKQLYHLGFIISVDNIGAGFSAIHLLKELPIHMIKIDKGLIKDFEDIEFTDKDRTMVTHIISYAKSMNMEVLAGGVETKSQKDMLEAQSCDMVQGFYYHKPMSLKEFEELLKA